jgi:hypothetical protein
MSFYIEDHNHFLRRLIAFDISILHSLAIDAEQPLAYWSLRSRNPTHDGSPAYSNPLSDIYILLSEPATIFLFNWHSKAIQMDISSENFRGTECVLERHMLAWCDMFVWKYGILGFVCIVQFLNCLTFPLVLVFRLIRCITLP